ncbi:MAG: M20/M25/M40 family metallo-hydrolase [Chloroflexi bacterium]|nr:M20/M25/M40 family metallo-hydrolase [Chloroflexota bacterium]
MDKFQTYINDNRERFVVELQDLCRQPSVAAQNWGMRETADKVLARLQKLGANARLIPIEGGAPVVYGEIGSGARTLMIYNHYDVQPPEPLELWESGPWDAAIRDGKLFARGVSDNKGNLMCRIQAVEAYLAAFGALPLKIKFVYEGEEEIGSIHLPQFARAHRDLLQDADGCLWEAGYKDVNDRPLLSCGVKGIIYVELHARGAKRDLHSASAAIVPNPAWRLTWALATLKDADDNILIDDYQTHVRPPTDAEMDALKAIPYDEDKVKADLGIPAFINGLTGIALLKKYLYEPTCTICGLYSGYIGEGSKTVLPNHAFAKIDFRLVPNLTPDLVLDLLKKHLARRGFDDIEVILTETGEEVARSPLDSALVRAAVAAAKAVYPTAPILYPTMAGSGPMYPLCQALGIPAVSAGCGWHDSRNHAPNENIRLADYFEHMAFMRELIARFSRATT